MNTNKESKLSVIVPVYNVREYVEECIESILNQTYTNLEVLLIINAPTDGSDKICERYAEKDRRIRLIYIPENHGVYPAWYTGGMSATGDYVTFVDADDYVDPNYFQEMMDKISDSDIICSYHSRITRQSKYLESFSVVPGKYSYDINGDKSINEIVYHMQSDKVYIFPAPWAKIYKVQLIKDTLSEIGELPSGGLHGWPDQAIVYTTFIKCKSIYIVKLFGYNYRLRHGSEGRRVRLNWLSEINSYYLCMKRIFEKSEYKDELIDSLEKFCLRRILDSGYQMGFSEKNYIPHFFIPFVSTISGKRIALYSAHITGVDYYHQICRQQFCDVAIWVSRNWQQKQKMGLPVESVEKLLCTDFDYLVIAVNREPTAQGIKDELIALGVDEEKILWEKPINILDY